MSTERNLISSPREGGQQQQASNQNSEDTKPINPFEESVKNNEAEEEAEAEQQRKEAFSERD